MESIEPRAFARIYIFNFPDVHDRTIRFTIISEIAFENAPWIRVQYATIAARGRPSWIIRFLSREYRETCLEKKTNRRYSPNSETCAITIGERIFTERFFLVSDPNGSKLTPKFVFARFNGYRAFR